MKTHSFKKYLITIIGTAVIMSVLSCRKTDDFALPEKQGEIENMRVSPDFKFNTTKDVGIRIITLDNSGAPVPNIRVDIYTDLPDKGGKLMMSGSTGEDGNFISDYKIPAGNDSLAIGTNALGFVNMQKVAVINGSINHVLGGKQESLNFKSGSDSYFKATNSIFISLGTYNSLGVPNYLEKTNDLIDAAMLSDINATLPEKIALPVSHPQYFAETNEPNIELKAPSNVWVTFVHEGAGYRNVMGYYKYDLKKPPVTTADIDSIFVVFPNVSFNGSGGGLASGNKVKIGTFGPGTGIGWVIIANGYDGSKVTNGLGIFYSDSKLNPETNPGLKKHTILCNDIGRGKFLLSFEDLRRDGSSDNDFNDAVFYVTADPITAVDVTNIPIPDYVASDSDKDGISDNFDNYPTDATKAFDNYYPAKNQVSTLAFEDLWPSKGDYDFNDMVVDYNFNQVTNGKNQVVQIKASLTLRAVGAGYHNGFGIQLPVSPGMVESVTGLSTGNSTIIKNSNGTEAGQSKATIVIFDDAFKILPFPGGTATGVNTSPGSVFVPSKPIDITINLASPVSLSSFGLPPYNPFIIIDGDRTREVHLIDNPPTDLANKSLLGTSYDKSMPESGRYYVTSNNLPFAIDIAGQFDYPIEKAPITAAHLKFYSWGVSGGKQYYDWFKSINGYRNDSNVYKY